MVLLKTGEFDQELRLLARAHSSKDAEKLNSSLQRNSVVLRTAPHVSRLHGTKWLAYLTSGVGRSPLSGENLAD